MSSEKRSTSNAIDLSHHLSDLAKNRTESPLKGMWKYMGKPGLIVMAGGTPHPNYFPFAAVHADGLPTDSFAVDSSRASSLSWLWNMFGTKEKKTIPITVPKYPTNPNDINLAVALQYDNGAGMEQVTKILEQFMANVYKPGYADWQVLCHVGNTDAWARAIQTLCNPGEIFLAEEWSYPSALASAAPLGIKAAPVAVDGQGLRSEDLRKVLAEWDEEARGAKRPHVLYTIPIGQNPTGSTMGLQRKKEVYDICVEYDVVIIEDDPYYFLQMPTYVPKNDRKTNLSAPDPETYIANLVPSFVRIDYQGRVIRLDTFSKTIAPGSRLGWFTCNPMFKERLFMHGQASVQGPAGLSQALIAQLLLTWKYEGYTRWLQGLGHEYMTRRDFFVDALYDAFELRPVSRVGIWDGCTAYDAYTKLGPREEKSALSETRLMSFVAPTAGMFVWVKFNFSPYAPTKHDTETLEIQLWDKLANSGLLVAPGWFFAADQVPGASPDSASEGHFRISFSTTEFEDMKRAAKILADVSREFVEELAGRRV